VSEDPATNNDSSDGPVDKTGGSPGANSETNAPDVQASDSSPLDPSAKPGEKPVVYYSNSSKLSTQLQFFV